ncbi:MAG: hypothetical protein OIF50_16250 [Flavobacteriaceae bacterium]|nr:hypothetical protein [Flavobacteriaceae bacterium]
MQEDFHGKHDPLFKFETMLKTDDVYFFDSEDFEEIIHHYLAIGKLSLAKKAAKLGLEQHPNAVSIELLRAEIMIFEDKLDLASALLTELQQMDPLNDEIYIQRAHIFSKQDNHEAAINMLENALDKGLHSFDLLEMLGMEFVFTDNYSKAKKYFMECLYIDGQDDSTLCNLMMCFNCLEEFEEGIGYLLEYIDGYPYSHYAWLELGRFYMMELQLSEALKAFDYAILINETHVSAYMEKAGALEMLGQMGDALEVYGDALKLQEPNAYLYYRVGKCYREVGHFEQARLHFFKAVQEDPMMYKAWVGIVNYYIDKKDFEKAISFLYKAIEIDPENDLYDENLDAIHRMLGFQIEEGIDLHVLQHLPKYKVQTWIEWGKLLLRTQSFHLALDVFVRAREYYPKEENIQLHLAGLYLRSNQLHHGQLQLEAALEKDTELVEVLEAYYPRVYKSPSVQKIIRNFLKK